VRLIYVAAFAALLAPALSAQTPARQDAVIGRTAARPQGGQPGDLDAQLNYSTGGDTRITTNKPAYVALFDLSRTGVTQIYPMFSGQAEYPTGPEHRTISVPNTSLTGGSVYFASSLMGLGGFPQIHDRWPHVLFLVASTSPLRVGGPWTTNIALNHDLIAQHHFADVQSDGSIEALVDLIKPLDPNAEMAFDRVDAIPSGVSQYASYSPGAMHTSFLGYYCSTWGQAGTYFTLIAIQDEASGNICTAVLPTKNVPQNTPPRDTAAQSMRIARAASASHKTGDPAAIRSYVEAYRSTHPFEQAAGQGGTGDATSTQVFGHGDASGTARASQSSAPASTRSSKP
jgi:hypothetical protein